jgi:hypothetical protein
MGDLAGNDIGWAIRKRRYVEKPDVKYAKIADKLCELGRFGQKTGMGWYRYEAGKRDAIPDPVVEKLIEDYRKEQGIVPRKIGDEEIVERCIYALVNEARACSRRASPSAPRTSTWCTSPATASRCTAAARCSMPTRSASTTSPAPRSASPPSRATGSGSRRRCWRSSPPKARRSTDRIPENRNDRCRHRFHRPHRLAKSWKRRFNMTHGATLGGHVVQHAVARAGIDPAEVEDVIMGCATPEGATGSNIARQIALRAGLPVTTAGVTVNRFCSSGLQTIAMAAQRIIAGEGAVYVAGGVESISCVQNEANRHMITEDLAEAAQAGDLLERCCRPPRQVAKRYNIPRERRTSTARAASSAPPPRGRRQVQRRDRADHRDRRRRRQGHRPPAHARKSRSPPTRASAPTPPTKASPRSSRRCPAA